MNRAILLDRDETLNSDPGYLNDPAKFQLLPGTVPGLRKLTGAGYLLIVITNQSGRNRGLISESQLQSVHQRMLSLLAAESITINQIYVCPHTEADNCNCRKPKSGLVEQAILDFDLNPNQCFIVGDRIRDIQAGQSFAIPGILVGHSEPDAIDDLPANFKKRCFDLSDAADYILSVKNS